MYIKLIKETTHKNGDVTYTYNIDKEFKNIIKKKYNKKRYTSKLGNRFMIEALYNRLQKNLDMAYLEAKKLNGLK